MDKKDNQKSNSYKSGLAPELGSDPQVLILGTFPGEESLENTKYYAYKNNQFWKIMSEIFKFDYGDPKNDLDYQKMVDIITKHGISVWDVIESCSRTGSSDRSISNPSKNDIVGFLQKNPSFSCIAFNGEEAKEYWKKWHLDDRIIEENLNLKELVLSSTSPMNTHKNLREKIIEWEQILQFCSILE